jgi:ABC-type polysaccharide transport system permease subunit
MNIVGDRPIERRLAPVQAAVSSSRVSWRKDAQRHWQYYLMVLPGLLSILIFGYGPLFGLSIAFLDYSPVRGIGGSAWVGLKHFEAAFTNPFFGAALVNTVIIKGLQTLIGFPAAVILALLLNEVRVRWFKGAVQTATMLPYFVSWIVAAAMFRNMLAPSDGIVNEVLQHVFGRQEPVLFLSDPIRFRWLMVLQDTWKFAGFFAVIYLAAIANIDPTLYEAAMVDGASRWQQTLHITLPGIRATMLTLFIILIGYLIIGSFEQIFAQYNVAVYATSDILETFTFRLGLQQSKYSFATAVGLFQSVVAAGLVLLTNFLVRRFDQEGLF